MEPPGNQPKQKTKAKLRYLKAKKNRRKSRKAAANVNPNGKREESHNGDADIRSESDASEHLAEEVENEVTALEPRDEATEMKRPKKRRKLSVEAEAPSLEQSQKPRSPTPNVTLPSFPLPALPDAPSKSELARQGLDAALLGAELVNHTKTLPIDADGDEENIDALGLSRKTRQRLHQLGITELFAVQTALLPFLLRKECRALYLPYSPPQDVCVSAPTGSGKTLAYAVPIVEILSTRIVTRLRALIVLPTRDLVTQVRETFEAVGKGKGLKIATATGQHSFSHEQNQLVADTSTRLQGGSSKADILICTPGRLIDHLNGTPNFSLQHLRFLVIDEADRLLAQSFQGWLAQVISALHPTVPGSLPEPSLIPYADAVAPSYPLEPQLPAFISEKPVSSCQKLLFSATLTTDPGKIAAIALRNPKYFIVQSGNSGTVADDVVLEKFTMPASLTEHMLVCSSSDKPLILFHLIHKHNVRNVLVFTKSAESTSRLVKLFAFFEQSMATGSSQKPVVASAYSSDLASGERKAILDRFKAQEIDILICSDLISRGIDIQHVSHVVSYDAPVDMRKYVHRVGRTARAGRSGDAWTLVEEQEARYFKQMLKAADHLKDVRKLKVEKGDVEDLKPHYEVALNKLKEAYAKL